MPSLEIRKGKQVKKILNSANPIPKGWKKVAVVFKDENGLWAGTSCPFPSMENYGCDDEGMGICKTRKEAVAACEEDGCIVITNKEAKEKYL